MEDKYENTIKEVRDMLKRLGLTMINRGPTARYMLRFTMKRRWGNTKKFAYECSLENLPTYIAQIEAMGGKIVGIDS